MVPAVNILPSLNGQDNDNGQMYEEFMEYDRTAAAMLCCDVPPYGVMCIYESSIDCIYCIGTNIDCAEAGLQRRVSVTMMISGF